MTNLWTKISKPCMTNTKICKLSSKWTTKISNKLNKMDATLTNWKKIWHNWNKKKSNWSPKSEIMRPRRDLAKNSKLFWKLQINLEWSKKRKLHFFNEDNNKSKCLSKLNNNFWPLNNVWSILRKHFRLTNRPMRWCTISVKKSREIELFAMIVWELNFKKKNKLFNNFLKLFKAPVSQLQILTNLNTKFKI